MKLTGKTKAIPKELLIDEEEDAQVAKETTLIEESEVYDRIKKDLEKMSPEKQKMLWHHIQGILHSNMLAHRHAAESAEHLAEASKLLSTLGIITFANTTAHPLVGIHLPIMNQFIKAAEQKHEETVQECQGQYLPIDEICLEQNLPRDVREWEFQAEGDANHRLQQS